MNRTTVIVTLIASAAFVLAGETNRTSEPATGRYQLMSGEHAILGTGLYDRTILRIDTVTGRVDEWVSGKDKSGNQVDHWYETGVSKP